MEGTTQNFLNTSGKIRDKKPSLRYQVPKGETKRYKRQKIDLENKSKTFSNAKINVLLETVY